MNNIPIFLSSDNNYSPFIATTIASICDNTKSFCNFYILDNKIELKNKTKIEKLKEQFNNFSIEYIKIDTQKIFKNINYKNNEYISLATYNRLLIPNLKPELKKALYLDIDIIVLGDIQKLYDINLEQYIIGAAWDKSRVLYNTDTKELMELSDNYKYFNAGVLLIDIPKWNKNKVTNQLFELEKKYKKNILHADETLLNKYFDNNYKIFDIKFNYTDYDVLNHPTNDIVIRHFASSIKPWTANFSILNKKITPLKNFDDFWKYANMTEFKDEIKNMYNKNINKSVFTKQIAKRFKREL